MTGYNDFASLICSGLVCSCAQTEDSYSNPEVIKFRLSHLSFSNRNLTKPGSKAHKSYHFLRGLQKTLSADTLAVLRTIWETLGNTCCPWEPSCIASPEVSLSALVEQKLSPRRFLGKGVQGSRLDIEDEQSQGGVCVLGTLLMIPAWLRFPPNTGPFLTIFFSSGDIKPRNTRAELKMSSRW